MGVGESSVSLNAVTSGRCALAFISSAIIGSSICGERPATCRSPSLEGGSGLS